MKKIKIVIVSLLFFWMGCGEAAQKRGGIGELCIGGADDCRLGLVCSSIGICENSTPGSFTCDTACQNLAECGERDTGCESDCRITVKNWAPVVSTAFVECLSVSACSVLKDNQGPQYCYQQLATPKLKFESCDKMAGRCGLGDDFRKNCHKVARLSTNEDFENFKSCENQTCDNAKSCIDSSALFNTHDTQE